MHLEVIGTSSGLSVFAERLAQVGDNPFLLLAPAPKTKLADKKDPMAELYVALQSGAKQAHEVAFFADRSWPPEEQNALALKFMRERFRGIEQRAQDHLQALELEGLTNLDEFLQLHVGFSARVAWEPEESEFLLKGELQFRSEAADDSVDNSFKKLASAHPGIGFLMSGHHRNRRLTQMVTAELVQGLEELQQGRQALIHELGL